MEFCIFAKEGAKKSFFSYSSTDTASSRVTLDKTINLTFSLSTFVVGVVLHFFAKDLFSISSGDVDSEISAS